MLQNGANTLTLHVYDLPAVSRWEDVVDECIVNVIPQDIFQEILGHFPAIFEGIKQLLTKSFPNHNQMVFVPEPKQIMSTVLWFEELD